MFDRHFFFSITKKKIENHQRILIVQNSSLISQGHCSCRWSFSNLLQIWHSLYGSEQKTQFVFQTCLNMPACQSNLKPPKGTIAWKERWGKADNSMPPVKQKIAKNQVCLLYQKYVKAVFFRDIFLDFTAWKKEKNTTHLNYWIISRDNIFTSPCAIYSRFFSFSRIDPAFVYFKRPSSSELT